MGLDFVEGNAVVVIYLELWLALKVGSTADKDASSCATRFQNRPKGSMELHRLGSYAPEELYARKIFQESKTYLSSPV